MKILKKDIQYVKGVGPKRLSMLKKLKIFNVEDMIYHFPRDYDNRTLSKKIIELEPGDKTTIHGAVLGKGQSLRVRKGLNIIKYLVKDDSGFITITFFNQPYMKNKFKPNDSIMVNGKVKMGLQGLEMINPVFEVVSNEKKSTLESIVPIYSSTEGFTQNQMIQIKKNIMTMVYGN